MIGLHPIKHECDLSDEEEVECWVESPYLQYFCRGAYFQQETNLDKSSLTRFHRRIGGVGECLVQPAIRMAIIRC